MKFLKEKMSETEVLMFILSAGNTEEVIECEVLPAEAVGLSEPVHAGAARLEKLSLQLSVFSS